MEKINLFIGCGETLRIEKENGVCRFLICDDDVAMKEVDEESFVKFYNDLWNVCTHTWDKKLRERYLEVEKFFEKPYYIFAEFYGEFGIVYDRNRNPFSYRAHNREQALEMFIKDQNVKEDYLYSARMDSEWAKKIHAWERECEDYEIVGARHIEI